MTRGRIKRAAFFQRAFNANAPAVRLDDLLGYGQTQAGAARVGTARSVGTIEPLEDVGYFVRVNADAVVLHFEKHLSGAEFRVQDYVPAGWGIV
jgi:hypothetical protein